MKDLPDHFLFNGSLFCAEGKYEIIYVYLCTVKYLFNLLVHISVVSSVIVCA